MSTDDLTRQTQDIEHKIAQIAQIDAEILKARDELKRIEEHNSLLEAEIAEERNKVVRMQACIILLKKEF